MILAAGANATSFAADWGPLLVTAVLAVLTGWYAILTKRLADSSERSAGSAKKAAEASQAAAQVAKSSMYVGFRLTPFFSRGEPVDSLEARTVIAGTELESDGATVFVHGLRIDRLHVPIGPHAGKWIDVGEDLTATIAMFAKGQNDLPVRLHRGEKVFCHRSKPIASDPERLVEMEATVTYSLDGDAQYATPRRVHWRGNPGVDYDN
ncbi:hypothetical protein KUV85_00645 [Nocardioides panacisoli]|uniref:hypothetical protein n=1 Tax=Nocardioides panacisoli TaxID=627624 RepID=UPI001C633459|nr:hypothetical protein [Nocardioides panacisoli]QYJ04222.1 hypothetical protein KUV85_00645 [Nocardioides panacisoli]